MRLPRPYSDFKTPEDLCDYLFDLGITDTVLTLNFLEQWGNEQPELRKNALLNDIEIRMITVNDMLNFYKQLDDKTPQDHANFAKWRKEKNYLENLKKENR